MPIPSEVGDYPNKRIYVWFDAVIGYYSAAIETLKFGGPAPAFAGSSNWGLTVVLPSFQRVLLGEIKPEEAVDVMMNGLDKAVKG